MACKHYDTFGICPFLHGIVLPDSGEEQDFIDQPQADAILHYINLWWDIDLDVLVECTVHCSMGYPGITCLDRSEMPF